MMEDNKTVLIEFHASWSYQTGWNIIFNERELLMREKHLKDPKTGATYPLPSKEQWGKPLPEHDFQKYIGTREPIFMEAYCQKAEVELVKSRMVQFLLTEANRIMSSAMELQAKCLDYSNKS